MKKNVVWIIFLINFPYFIKSVISDKDFELLEETFNQYTQKFNRSFCHDYEKDRHFNDFKSNYRTILDHNKMYENGKTTFKIGLNNMADLNNEKYLKNFVRLTNSLRNDEDNDDDDDDQEQIQGSSPFTSDFNLMNSIPNSIDWRSSGFVTKLDNQGSCGSCYALSIVYSIEGQLFKRTGKVIPLSIQQLVDCSISTGNHGCSGGSLRNTLKYLELHGGIMRDEDYPYTGRQGKCKFVHELSLVNVTSWNILPKNDEDAIKIAVATIGPIAVSLNASPSTFQLYKEGIYDDNSCKSDIVNHAMLIVGYTPDYWILKNWWGKGWGENGYIRIKRGKNMCGIARYAAYAIV